MIPPLNLAQLNQQLNEWCARIVETESTIADPERRAQLRQALTQIQQSQAKLNADYDREMQALATRTASVQREITDLESRIKEAEAEGRRRAAAAPPPPAAPAPIDLERGPRLRRELLDRYAPKTPASSNNVQEGSVSKGWKETEASESSEPISESSEPISESSDSGSDASSQRTTQKREHWEDFSQFE